MAGFHDNLWAPWRMDYIRSLGEETAGGCFLCRYARDPAADAAHHVVLRTQHTLITLNRFPYNNGHLLVAPLVHKPSPCDLSEPESLDLMRLVCASVEGLAATLSAQGFNIGMNLGHCAGAGLPDHLHWHIVPRWAGDTNYMSVIADTRVIPESLEQNYRRLHEWFLARGERAGASASRGATSP